MVTPKIEISEHLSTFRMSGQNEAIDIARTEKDADIRTRTMGSLKYHVAIIFSASVVTIILITSAK